MLSAAGGAPRGRRVDGEVGLAHAGDGQRAARRVPSLRPPFSQRWKRSSLAVACGSSSAGAAGRSGYRARDRAERAPRRRTRAEPQLAPPAAARRAAAAPSSAPEPGARGGGCRSGCPVSSGSGSSLGFGTKWATRSTISRLVDFVRPAPPSDQLREDVRAPPTDGASAGAETLTCRRPSSSL